uniref:Uncharacterized protein n=1 Tax=Glossina austeni TaxID=7395 RepID=A0A1A9VXQ8_GLOAU
MNINSDQLRIVISIKFDYGSEERCHQTTKQTNKQQCGINNKIIGEMISASGAYIDLEVIEASTTYHKRRVYSLTETNFAFEYLSTKIVENGFTFLYVSGVICANMCSFLLASSVYL